MIEPVRVGLLGRDILASRSPWLHEQEAAAHGFELRYELFDFTARGLRDSELASWVERLMQTGYAGVNVTYPFKQSVIACLHEVAPGAERVGAVNTVRFAGQRAVGFNTDVTGFATALRQGLVGAAFATVVQVGAGGGGAATAVALLERGVGALTIFDRDASRAAALVARLRAAFPARAVAVGGDWPAAMRQADGVVNATPVGMAKLPGTAVPPEWLEARHWVADIVYFPLVTELLRIAAAKGCRVLDGAAMAVGQAAVAFELFTGRSADVPRMRQSFDRYSVQARTEPRS